MLDFCFAFSCFSYRKDSFITHRAFCDALAEESARITTVSATNILNNLRNDSNILLHQQDQSLIDHHTNNNLPSLGDISGLSQFSHSDHFLRDFEDHQQKNRSPLSLWLNQASAETAINNNNNNISNFFGASSSSSNLFGSITENGLSMLPVIEKEDVENKGSNNLSKATSSSAAALLSGQSSQSVVSSSPMSATALLQKAALMGSTRSNNNNSVLFGAGAFGVMSSSSSSSSNAVSLNSLNKSRSLTMADSVQMIGTNSDLSSNCLSQLLIPPNGKFNFYPQL